MSKVAIWESVVKAKSVLLLTKYAEAVNQCFNSRLASNGEPRLPVEVRTVLSRMLLNNPIIDIEKHQRMEPNWIPFDKGGIEFDEQRRLTFAGEPLALFEKPKDIIPLAGMFRYENGTWLLSLFTVPWGTDLSTELVALKIKITAT